VLIEAIGLGLFVGIIYYSIVGLMPGGLVVPGYMALYLHTPLRIVSTFLAAGITYLLVRYVIEHFVILYGRRRYLAMVMIGFIVKWLSDYLFTYLPLRGVVSTPTEARIIGYVIAGLIANTFYEQGILPTTVSTIITAIVVRLLLILLVF
jgi:poly-gamma-glutamate biosynthesis protein PgsC/CapC